MSATPAGEAPRRELALVAGAAVAAGIGLLTREPGLGLAALAGVGAAALLRPLPRAAVALVVALLATAALALAVARGDLVLAGSGVVLLGASGVAIARSRRWPSPRTGSPTREPSARDTWDALDRGEDPTA